MGTISGGRGAGNRTGAEAAEGRHDRRTVPDKKNQLSHLCQHRNGGRGERDIEWG